MSEETAEIKDEQCSQFLGFMLDQEEYAVPIHLVREIIAAIPVVKVPDLPNVVKGIVNLRGRIIPMIDLKRKFGLSESENIKTTCYIILDINQKQIGVIVDQVNEVVDFESSQIEPTKNFSDWQQSEVFIGVGKKDDRVIILADLSKTLSASEIDQIMSKSK